MQFAFYSVHFNSTSGESMYVQGELTELLIVWHRVKKKPVSGKQLTEGAQEARITTILVRPLAV